MFKFIDLFAGIGGFHQAMRDLGGECVFASEIDKYAIDTYMKNYNIDANCDITKVNSEDIPKHDVLCAGFPCQAFSKAGKQLGFEDKTKGTLFFEIIRILKYHKPKYIILENVKNLITHDKGNTIKVIEENLDNVGYNFKIVGMSPHQLGTPQLRERVYVLGVRKDIYDEELKFKLPKEDVKDYEEILEEETEEGYNISEHEEEVLRCWDEFYYGIKEDVIGFPIWSFEFGSTESLDELPEWKANICNKNRNLYQNNKEFIDEWLKRWNNLENFSQSEKKLEWQAGRHISSIWDGFVTYRPSGIRVKKPTYFPTLVALVQIPIIGKYKRKLTVREVGRLQGFPDDFVYNENQYQAYKQFGNSVNVDCVKYLAKQLFEQCDGDINNN